MNSKAKTKPAWSHPEFYFGLAGFLGFFLLPYVRVIPFQFKRFYLTGFNLMAGDIPVELIGKAEIIYYDPIVIFSLVMIPVLCLGLIFFSAFDFSRVRRLLSISFLLVMLGFTGYLRGDFLEINQKDDLFYYRSAQTRIRSNENAPSHDHLPSNVRDSSYHYAPPVIFVSGFWITLLLSVLSVFSNRIYRMFNFRGSALHADTSSGTESKPGDIFSD